MTALALPVTEVECESLRRRASLTVLAHRQVVQARGLLLAADGVAIQAIARLSRWIPMRCAAGAHGSR